MAGVLHGCDAHEAELILSNRLVKHRIDGRNGEFWSEGS